MPQYSFLIFGADNITNPYSPGEFPKESTVSPGVSVLADGDQIVWLGGGERQLVTLDDNDNRIPNSTKHPRVKSS